MDDCLVIYGGEKFSRTLLGPHDDYRLAMSPAVVGLRVPEIIITNEKCVNKSFPCFWKLWYKL
jgi:3-phosphoshikimate 1-carboxyvinyltransferase